MKRQAGFANETTGVLLPSSLTESFEVALARVADLHDSGAKLKVLVCDGAVRGCVANPLSLAATCNHCRRIRTDAVSRLAQGTETISLDALYARAPQVRLDEAEQQELSACVESTILTFYRRDAARSSRRSLRSVVFEALFRRYHRHTLFVHAATRALLSSGSVDRIEFFNGRIVPTRGAMIAARHAGRDFGVIEVSGQDRKLTVASNSSVHDLAFKRAELAQFIDSGAADRQRGVAFYEYRRNGLETNDRSFTRHQQQGLLGPAGRPVVAIFTSSADELKVSGPQWFTEASREPVHFITALADLLANEFEVIVRMHPNQQGDKTGAAAAMQAALAKSPRIRLVPPRSKVSTYELIDAAAAVITFGSTVGLEATYWGKPSILAGRAVWDEAGVAYTAETANEVAGLLRGKLSPRSKEIAIQVGAYYQQGCGTAGSLSWRPGGRTGFAVHGTSFLAAKRSSPAYWINRLADRLLRRI